MLFREDAKYKDNNRLFSVLLCMRFLCWEYEDWGTNVDSIRDLIDEYNDVVKLGGLGFSEGWEKKLLDQEPDGLPYKRLYG